MAGRKPANPPMPFPEIVKDLEERKPSRLYKADNAEFQDQRISEIVRLGAEELALIADGKSAVSLSDTKALQVHTITYLKACEETSTIPTMSGLARSLGYSAEALNKHMREHHGSKSAEWLQIVHDAFADQLAAAALQGSVQPVVAIFTLKARSGWRDTLTIEPMPSRIDGPELDNTALAEKYLNLEEYE